MPSRRYQFTLSEEAARFAAYCRSHKKESGPVRTAGKSTVELELPDDAAAGRCDRIALLLAVDGEVSVAQPWGLWKLREDHE
jgi:hypothetical protein